MIHSLRSGASDGYPDIAFKLFLFSRLSFDHQILGSLSYHIARSLTRSMTKPDDSPLDAKPSNEIVATRVPQEIRLDAAHSAAEWRSARPTAFCYDWRGENPDPGRETQVRLLWCPEKLYLRFECRFREIFLLGTRSPTGGVIICGIAMWRKPSCSPILRSRVITANLKSAPTGCGLISTFFLADALISKADSSAR